MQRLSQARDWLKLGRDRRDTARTRLALVLLLSTLALLTLAGCGSGNGLNGAAADDTSESAPAGLSALEPPAELLRTASGSADTVLDGASYGADWPRARVAADGTAAVYSPAAGPEQTFDGLAYAVYRFQFPAAEPYAALYLAWDSAPATERVWVAFANWERGRWDWRVPTTAGLVEAPDFERYLDAERNLLVVVALGGGVPATLNRLTIEGEQAPGPGAWPQPAHDAQRTYRSELLGPITEMMKWSVPSAVYYEDGIALAEDGTIYSTSSSDGSFLARDSTGQVLWQSKRYAQNLGPPVIGTDGTLYACSGDGKVIAATPIGLKWSLDLGTNLKDQVLLGPDDTLYCTTRSTDELCAINPDGTLRWRTQAEIYGFSGISMPALGLHGEVYACSTYFGLLQAFDAEGEPLWTLELGDRCETPPCVDSMGRVVVAGEFFVHVISPEGQEQWSKVIPNYRTALAIGADDAIYVGSSNRVLHCLEPDGNERWAYPFEQHHSFGIDISSLALDADGKIYACGKNHSGYSAVFAFTPAGQLLWEWVGSSLNSSFRGEPVIGPEQSLYIRLDGDLYCFGFADEALYPPYRLTASHGSFPDRVELEWEWVGGGTAPASYKVYRATAPDGDSELLADVGAATGYTDSSVDPAEAYYYRVVACDTEGRESEPCEPAFGYATPAPPQGAWLGFMNTPQHTGRASVAGPVTNELKWVCADAHLTDYGSVVIDEAGVIYSGMGSLSAINPDGTIRWTSPTGYGSQGSPSLGVFGTIVVSDRALNPDGSMFWKKWLVSEWYWNTVGPDGMIWLCENFNYLWAIYPSGEVAWAVDVSPGENAPYIDSYPALGYDGTVYVSSGDYVYAIDPANGAGKWAFEMSGYCSYSSCAIGPDGTIYVGNSDRNLYAINPDGSEKWKYLTGGPIAATPAIGLDGTIYVGSYDKKFYCFEPGGSQRWAFTAGSGFNSSAAIDAAGRVYVGCNDKKVYCINPDGSELWSYTTDEEVDGSPAIAPDGTLYISSGRDGNLYAFGEGG